MKCETGSRLKVQGSRQNLMAKESYKIEEPEIDNTE
jgi:hypothetical protein